MHTLQPLVVVAGPTASGKTALAVELARRLDGEVVSADSMQVYLPLRIGTARPTAEEMEGIPHHLLGFLPLCTSYSVAQYAADAHAAIARVGERGRLPILCGGTGLYIQAVTDNLVFPERAGDPALRAALRGRAETEGGEGLLEELRAVDPDTALPEHPPGERNEDKAADEKPREVQLDRIKQSGNFLERDFHRAEKQRCQCNKQVTSFHNGISPYCKTGVPSRDGHSSRTPPQRGHLLPPVRTLRPFMRKMKYTHEKHAIKLMIRSAWTALFQRLLTSGLFSFFSGQAAYEGMARV